MSLTYDPKTIYLSVFFADSRRQDVALRFEHRSLLKERSFFCLMREAPSLACLRAISDSRLLNYRRDEWHKRGENAAPSLEPLNLNLGEKFNPTVEKSREKVNVSFELNVVDNVERVNAAIFETAPR